MENLLIAAAIGLVAGIIDVVPMLIQKLDKKSCISAFVHYFVLGFIIPFVHWDLAPWLKGSIVAFLLSVPVMVIVYPVDKKAIIPMIVFALILGALIGVAGASFINQ
jgi:hypothetical protein